MFDSILSSFSAVPLSLKQGENVNGVEIAAVVISGLAVVFAALILLILFVWIYGKIFDSIKSKKKKSRDNEVKEKISTIKTELPQSDEVSLQEDSEEDEVVAAISAVIAQIADEEGTNLRVKSIRPALQSRNSGQNAWALEGLRQNTAPF